MEDVDENDVLAVLDQEAVELVDLLRSQAPAVLETLYSMMDHRSRRRLERLDLLGRLAEMIKYFRASGPALCSQFLETLCMECENIPMRLESRLVSVAGTTSVPMETVDCSSHLVGEDNSLSHAHTLEGHGKRQCIDHVGCYSAAIRKMLLQRWERAVQNVLTEVSLDETWVSLRHGNPGKPRDRPDRTPTADRMDRTTDILEVEEGIMEDRVSVASFLERSAGKVVVLLGPAGSGKTLQMSCVGQRWAQGLLPSYSLLVLLEFRQLNLLTSPLSLADLLLQWFLQPQGGDPEARAVLDFISDNPERTCWILDGYDEFHSKIQLGKERGSQERGSQEGALGGEMEEMGGALNLWSPLPIARLVSGLCSRRVLPGCTLLLTCRPRDLGDLEEGVDCVGELLGFDRCRVKEYAAKYFQVRGQGQGEEALKMLLTNNHLLSLSYLPSLCHICCVYLEHMLCPQASQPSPQDCPRPQLPQSHQTSKLPSTLTQVYLTVLWALLCQRPGKTPPRAPLHWPGGPPPLHVYRSEVRELGRLAMQGLDKGKILFLSDELTPKLLDLGLRTGLLSQVEVTLQDVSRGKGFTFTHLTLQEFLCALHIMTSDEVNEAQLKRKFNLRSRWTTRADPKTVFTDSLHLYMCGLASPACTPTLVRLAEKAGAGDSAGAGAGGRTLSGSGFGAETWVKKHQAVVLKLLKSLAGSSSLTGPKVVELYRCVQETQNVELAREVVGSRPCMELRNIRLNPVDLDAIAFAVASAGVDFDLDFGACSMDLECLDILPSCKHLHHLTFRGRKYDDWFADKLCSILPKLPTLRKLEFTSANLTDVGAARLSKALEECPNITDINLSDNSLTDDGIREVAEVFSRLPNLASVMLGGKNSCSLGSVLAVLEKTSSSANLESIYADGKKEIKVVFSLKSSISSHKDTPGLTVRLLNQKMSGQQVLRLCELLACFPALSVLDLSGGLWEENSLQALTGALQQLSITQSLLLNDSSLSVDELLAMTSLLSQCPNVVKIDIRLPVHVSVEFIGSRQTHNPGNETEATGVGVGMKLRMQGCGLLPSHLERLSDSLVRCSDLALLDLSRNSLGTKGLQVLLDLLPQLSTIQQIHLGENDVSMEGVSLLAGALCSQRNLSEVSVSDGGKKIVLLKFLPSTGHQPSDPRSSGGLDQGKKLGVTSSALKALDVTNLCRKLLHCPSPLEIDLSHTSLKDEAVGSLRKILPQMTTLHTLNLSHAHMSTNGALLLVSCLGDCQRVREVDLRCQGESFIRLGEKTDRRSCRLSHYSLSCANVENLSRILQQCPNLSDLDLSSNLLRDEGVKTFVEYLPSLRIASSVSLNDNGLSKEGLLHLVSAILSCARVSSVEVSLGSEERLSIRFQPDNHCGQTLSLNACSFQEEQLSRLAEILCSCASLDKLQLRDNGLGMQQVVGLVEQLICDHRQRSVSVKEHWVGAQTAVELVSSCLELNPNIHTLRVNHSTLHITLKDKTEFYRSSGGSSGCLPVVKISLVDSAESRLHLEAMSSVLQRCAFLQDLLLSGCSLSREGVKVLCSALPSLAHLTTLSLDSKETCEDGVILLAEGLLHTKTLQNLKLTGHVISDIGVEALIRALTGLPALTSVDLSLCSGWTAAGGVELMSGLGQCVFLQNINLDSVSLDEQSLSCLTQGLPHLSSLRTLNLNNVMVRNSSENQAVVLLLGSLKRLTYLEEIELDCLRMGDGGVEELTTHVTSWTQLRRLRLSQNLVSDPAGDKLLQALSSCSHLQELQLSGNSLGVACAARMAQVLPSLTHIAVLDLSENKFGAEGSASLSKALVSMKSLVKLHLTSIGTPDLASLAASLDHCVSVQDVSLAWNGCQDDVAVELANVLPRCLKLQRLDLEANDISIAGAETLVRSLKSCPSLQLLRLWKNRISQSDACRLTQKDQRVNFSST
ncbi:NLR family, CARD domain containing 5 [Hypomesus transpacificus]|uniref:NLR family, CARD domain containing 5 n=1 Tax=Hypomesus transpacificus TaxID=137520 RepID=UPI001F07A99D|nr:NLR family, CARD domain containing 5 [Hypomesus transpacificus]